MSDRPRHSRARLLGRRRALKALVLGLGLGALASPLPLTASTAVPIGAGGTGRSRAIGDLVAQLARSPQAVHRSADGRSSIFGVELSEASSVFYPVSRDHALPEGFAPRDLVDSLGHPIRALAAADFTAMIEAAEADHAYLEIISGYRSADLQAELFDRAIDRQLARDSNLSRAEAERLAARYVAPPSRSQHQLGTTADLSTWEIGYSIRAAFSQTKAGRWLMEHAWEFGFITPYTLAAEARSGYVPEPWHVRWIGRDLAALLWQHDYLHSGFPTADDWLAAVEELVAQQLAMVTMPGSRVAPVTAQEKPHASTTALRVTEG